MAQGRCAVVFDTGSSATRVGLSRDATPLTFPTFVTVIDGAAVVGHQPQHQRGKEKRVVNGSEQDWNHMPAIWEHGFKLLQVQPENHPVLLNKFHFSLKAQSQKMTQIMFETFNVPALHLNLQPVLSLYGRGSLTGLVVESGFCETQFYPVYEGHVLEGPMRRELPVAGDFLTLLLCDALGEKGYKCDYETANDMKEKSFYVSISTDSDENGVGESFTLPDGNTVTLDRERYLIPEELYSSSSGRDGIHQYVYSALYRCDPELRKIFFENIVLSGGNTRLPGFAQRLETELIKARSDYRFVQNCDPKITSSGLNSAWLGGTVLASLSTFPDMCMTREEYDEWGPYLSDTKFF